MLELRRRLLIARDMEGFADLFTDDAVIEVPFAGGGMPTRLAGRDAIREFSVRSGSLPVEISDLHVRHFHRTTDPEVVIVELTTVGRIVATGERFEVPCIQVFRIKDGRIALFRDYVDTGLLPDLTPTEDRRPAS
ncbi:hypothetical protein GCM10009727_36040 [Actinomadura napierensis]|uniref:SnoaL-like domain-containing protein n=1 Tax=Actinomadura napierensis TaxID=267854 RepID=A0ABP5L2T6_9ACTN